MAIDARNRSLAAGFFERSSGKVLWLTRRRIGLVHGRSADEYAFLFRALAGEAAVAAGAREPRVEAAWLSSVVPSLTRDLAWAIDKAFGLAASVIGPGVRTGVKIRSDVPSEVGSDLICSAAAARELIGGACLVVDFDAAIAFSAIGRTGDFLGAAIAPGLGIAAENLREVAALLPQVALTWGLPGHEEDPIPAIGKTTVQSIRAGISLGYGGLVERILMRQSEELVALGEADSLASIAVLGTGEEEGRALFELLKLGSFVSDLALEGIAVIAGRAAPGHRTTAV